MIHDLCSISTRCRASCIALREEGKCVLKANVGVKDEECAEDGVGDWVQRSSGEGGNGQRNEPCGDDALECPVIASVGVGGVWHRRRVVGSPNDFLGQRGQDLVALGCVEGGNARRLGHGRALESRAQLLGERAVDGGGACDGRQHALRGRGLRDSLPQEAGTHD